MIRPCPICGEPAAWDDNPDRPFCSERCRLIDLGQWSSESYAIESSDDDETGRPGVGAPEDFQPS